VVPAVTDWSVTDPNLYDRLEAFGQDVRPEGWYDWPGPESEAEVLLAQALLGGVDEVIALLPVPDGHTASAAPTSADCHAPGREAA
jgi:hypothetical protein